MSRIVLPPPTRDSNGYLTPPSLAVPRMPATLTVEYEPGLTLTIDLNLYGLDLNLDDAIPWISEADGLLAARHSSRYSAPAVAMLTGETRPGDAYNWMTITDRRAAPGRPL